MSDAAAGPVPTHDAAAITILELDPPAGVKRLLPKPDLTIRGRLSDTSIRTVAIVFSGAPPLERPVQPDGTFHATFAGLPIQITWVEVRAGAAPRATVARIPLAIVGAVPKVTLTAPERWTSGALGVSCVVEAWRPKTARLVLKVDGAPHGAPVERPLGDEGLARARFEPPASARTLRIEVEGEDEAGKKGVAAADVAVDRRGPEATIAAPADGLEATGATIAFAGVARAGAAPLASVEVALGGRTRALEVAADGKVAADGLEVPAADGDYALELRARDAIGGIARVAVTVRARRQAAAAEAERKAREAEAERRKRGYLHAAPGGLAIDMVHVPAGELLYGDDKEPRAVASAFYIGRNPTTWREYLAFCAATGHERPPAPSWGIRDDHPVVNVRPADADAFCKWAGLELPSDEMWEKAARGTDGRKYPWGNEPPTPERCVWEKHPTNGRSTAPVGGRPAGASPCGALDMAGNVSEWIATATAGGRFRIYRGGSWGVDAEHCRAALRTPLAAAMRSDLLGFRPCLVRGE